jgi:hypothetical protein
MPRALGDARIDRFSQLAFDFHSENELQDMPFAVRRTRFDDVSQIADARFDAGFFAELADQRFRSRLSGFHAPARQKIRRSIRLHVPREQDLFFSDGERCDADPHHRFILQHFVMRDRKQVFPTTIPINSREHGLRAIAAAAFSGRCIEP